MFKQILQNKFYYLKSIFFLGFGGLYCFGIYKIINPKPVKYGEAIEINCDNVKYIFPGPIIGDESKSEKTGGKYYN